MTSFHAVERPPLRLAADAKPAGKPTTWWSQDLAGTGPFEFKAGEIAVAAVPGDEPAALMRVLGPAGEKRIRIALPPNSGRLDRLRARIQTESFQSLELRRLRGDELIGSDWTQLFAEAHAGEYSIEIPASAATDFDRIELVVTGDGPVRVGRVELDELSPAQRLPQPPAPSTWVRCSEDVRAGWGLSTQAPMECSFTPSAGDVLVMSALVPQSMRIPGSRPVLTMRLRGAPGEPRLYRWPLVADEGRSSDWIWLRVPLDELAGIALTARFELQTSGVEAVCALTQPQIVSFDDTAPTVLLITSDTHRGDALSLAHDGLGVATPVLDRLAAQGVCFDACMSAANVTIPSHSAIMTGVSPRDSGLLDNSHALAPDGITLAERFREHGWATIAAVSAAHLDAAWSGLGQGFDRVAVSHDSKRDAGATLTLLEEWIPEYRGRPLFIWLHLFDAHTPYQPPKDFAARYWPSGRNPWDKKLPEPPAGSIPPYLNGVRDVDWIRSRYLGEVAYLDSELARLFARTRMEQAIIAFTADHGESLGAHQVWWDHAGLYQDSLHVPLILRWPGGPRGLRIGQRVSNLDLGRTLLDLAGLEGVAMPGKSLLGALESNAPSAPVFALACFGLSASITDGDEHLILHLVDHELGPGELRERHASELYDLGRDPGCVHELSAERPARARELRARLIEWLRAVRPLTWSQLPEGNVGSIDRLHALGYVQGEQHDARTAWFPAQCDCKHCSTKP